MINKSSLRCIIVVFIIMRLVVLSLFIILPKSALDTVQNDSIHHYYGGLIAIVIGLLVKQPKAKNFLIFGGIGVVLEELFIILEQLQIISSHHYLTPIDYLYFFSLLIILLVVHSTRRVEGKITATRNDVKCGHIRARLVL